MLLSSASLLNSAVHYGTHIRLTQNKTTLEKIQRRTARFVKYDYNYASRVTNMVKELDRSNCEEMKKNLLIILMFKTIHNQIAAPSRNMLVPADSRI